MNNSVSQLPGAVTAGFFQIIPLEKLFIDHSYQRLIVEPKVKRLVKNWNPVGAGYLVVSRRSDGRYAILDGQHRYFAMKQLELERCGCLVYTGLSHTDEAKAFHVLNVDRALPTALDRFKAAVQYEDYDCLQIKKVTEGCGFHIDFAGSKSSEKGIVAVSGLSHVYAIGGESLLEDTLNMISVCFDGEKRAIQAVCIKGLGRFLKHYQELPAFSKKKFVNQMQKNSFTHLVKRKNFYIEAYGCGAEAAFAMALLEAYNKQLSTNRLPNILIIKAMQEAEEAEE